MSEWKEYTAKTVNEALTAALTELGVSKNQVEYEVTSEEKTGLLGLFSKPAVIRVRLKEDKAAQPKVDKPVQASEQKQVAAIKPMADDQKETSSQGAEAYSQKTEAAENDPDSLKKAAGEFLISVFKAMKMEIRVEISYEVDNNVMNIELFGDNMGPLIGKRGATLDSLQYLTSLVVNRESNGYVKVKLDTENFRARRKETLENLARNIAHKVKRTHRPVYLEPMNPYERRIIHSTLQDDEYVETYSKGEEPYRKVVVALKPGVDTGYGYRGGYGRGRSYNRGGRYHKKYHDSYRQKSHDHDDYAARHDRQDGYEARDESQNGFDEESGSFDQKD